MVELSVSFKTSSKQTSIKHNNRELTEEEFKQPQHWHIDQSKLQDNIYIKQEGLREAYDKLFGEALADYNAKQKRSDRRIVDYYQHVKKSKTLDLQREFVVGIGSKADWEKLNPDGKKIVGRMLAEYVEEFQQRHPHLYIYNAVVHLDEKGHPHAHFNVVPVATGYKKGLSCQPSFRKALANEGYMGVGRELLKEFRDGELKILSEKLKTLGAERKLVGTNDIKDMHEYKQMISEVESAREKAMSQIDVERSQRLSELENLVWEVEHLGNQKNALEGKIEALESEYGKIDQKLDDFYRDMADKFTLAQEHAEIAIQEVIARHNAEFPPDNFAQDKIFKLLELTGERDLDSLYANYEALKGQTWQLKELLGNVKTILQDVSLTNALKKGKQVLELVANYVPRVTTRDFLGRFNHVVGSLTPRRDVFQEKLARFKAEQTNTLRGQIRGVERGYDKGGRSL